MQLSASARLMAGPWVISPVPRPWLWQRRLIWGTSRTIPTSTGKTLAPAWAAIWQMLACPLVMFSATRAVISCPVWVTPWATTPLSAQNTVTALGARGQSRSPVRAQIFTTASSKKPSPRSGFAMESHRSLAARSTSLLGWRQLAAISCTVILLPSLLFLCIQFPC